MGLNWTKTLQSILYEIEFYSIYSLFKKKNTNSKFKNGQVQEDGYSSLVNQIIGIHLCYSINFTFR